MEIIENSDEKMIIRMNANEPLANAIRRSVVEIPVLAIDEVEIFKNDSALYDEVLAHRIGLIPLKTEKNMGDKTKIEFKLSKKGPCSVYAGDLSGNGKVVYEKIPITILGDDCKLEFVATANLGKSTEHAKYLAGLCYYRHILEVESSAKTDDIVKSSKGLIGSEKKGNKWICDLKEGEIESVLEVNDKAISNSSEILFIIESFGNMPAKEILTKAIKALSDNLSEFDKKIK